MENKIILYKDDMGKLSVNVRFADEDVWLTQAQLVEIYQSSKSNISEHIKHIFEDKELDETVVVRKFRTTTQHGAIEGKTQSHDVAHYNLDVVIALGYRVQSPIAVRFRRWATQRLHEYIQKGFTMDDERLKQGGNRYFKELLQRIRDIRSSERNFYQQVTDIYATSTDYDPRSKTTKLFFATVQNKMHYAVHEHTAAELIYERVDNEKPFVGMTNFKGNYVTRDDVKIAKNYLTELELQRLNLLTSQFLDYAEFQALEQNPMTMADWVAALDDIENHKNCLDVNAALDIIYSSDNPNKAEVSFGDIQNADNNYTPQRYTLKLDVPEGYVKVAMKDIATLKSTGNQIQDNGERGEYFKLLTYVDIIQAFSRTNRIFNEHEKPWGTIVYYAFPYTMEQNIEDALELYVDQPLGVFVDKLEQNLKTINGIFNHIRDIFQSNKIMNFEKLPDNQADRRMFAKDFSMLTKMIESAKLQGFMWEQSVYEFHHETSITTVTMEFDEQTYLILLQRYRELFGPGTGGNDKEFDYPIDTYITEIGTGKIDADYINSKFQKFIKQLYAEGPGSEQTKAALEELHKTFATLSQKDQRTAILILHAIQRGDLRPEPGKTLQDYINEYQLKELFDQMRVLHEATGVDFDKLKDIMTSGVTEENLNEFQRFSELRKTIDKDKTITFIEMVEGEVVSPQFMMVRWSALLKEFILSADSRERILYAYMHDGVTIQTAEVEDVDVEKGFDDLENPQQPESNEEPTINYIKNKIEDIIAFTLNGVSHNMRHRKEIVEALMYVIDKESLEKLDGVGVYLHRAFVNLFKESSNIVDKHVAFNLLATKYEAYLKKLYYLMKGEEIKPQHEGEDVTWKNVIHDVNCLWKLKYQLDDDHQRLYQYLNMIKEWRNAESHISPTASEQELNGAINIILTMYCYATGMCITDLEMAGHDIEPKSNVWMAAEPPITPSED